MVNVIIGGVLYPNPPGLSTSAMDLGHKGKGHIPEISGATLNKLASTLRQVRDENEEDGKMI